MSEKLPGSLEVATAREMVVSSATMSTPTRDEIVAIYQREAAREAEEVAHGTMKESSHATALAATRTHVQYLLREPPDSIASMQAAWQQTDMLIKAAGIWDAPPPPAAPPVAVSAKKKVA